MVASRFLFILALASAARAQSQPSEEELKKTLILACEGKITVRPQATRRLLTAGEAILPLVDDYAKAKGRNALSPSLVEGLGKVTGEKSRKLLRAWIDDRAFYWRPQAIRGLAAHKHADDLPVLRSLLNDVSAVARRAACDALAIAGDKESLPALRERLADPDHRARAGAAIALLALGDDGGLPVLVEHLRLDTEFFGDPVGLRARTEAFEALKKIAGQDFGYVPAEDGDKLQAAVARFEAWGQQRRHGEWKLPAAARAEHDPARYVCGLELRTCNLGELWLRLDDQGRLAVGLCRPERVVLEPTAAKALLDAARAVPAGDSRVFGIVLCDFERACGLSPTGQRTVQAAPGSRPPEVAAFVQQVAAALEASKRKDLADAVRERARLFDKS